MKQLGYRPADEDRYRACDTSIITNLSRPARGEHGHYRVIGKRDYRGHVPGTEFVARIEPNAERRAVARGAIQLLARVTPALEPGTYTFPDGWLAQPHTSTHEGRESGLLH